MTLLNDHAVIRFRSDATVQADRANMCVLLANENLWLRERLLCLLRMLKQFPEEVDENFPEMNRIHGPLWHKVAEMIGLGSASAMQLCIDLDEDPNHVKPQSEGPE